NLSGLTPYWRVEDPIDFDRCRPHRSTATFFACGAVMASKEKWLIEYYRNQDNHNVWLLRTRPPNLLIIHHKNKLKRNHADRWRLDERLHFQIGLRERRGVALAVGKGARVGPHAQQRVFRHLAHDLAGTHVDGAEDQILGARIEDDRVLVLCRIILRS